MADERDELRGTSKPSWCSTARCDSTQHDTLPPPARTCLTPGTTSLATSLATSHTRLPSGSGWIAIPVGSRASFCFRRLR